MTAAVTAAQSLRTTLHGSVLVVTIDRPGQSVNLLSTSLIGEFEDLLARIQGDAQIKGVVLISGKPDSFIAGADVEQFKDFTSAKAAERTSQLGQSLVTRLAALETPIVAAIHGACLGGGLELSLAARYRICTEDPKTVFALPEVQLGVIPGMGGTQRLPRLIGLQGALDMILAGRNVRPKRAMQLGLVNEIVHPAILLDIAIDRAARLGDGTFVTPRGESHGITELLLQENPLGRSVVFKKALASVLKTTHGNYPAPVAALAAIRAGYDHGVDHGLSVEAQKFGEMATTEISRQLVYIFFASNELKKESGAPAGTDPVPAPRPVRELGVLGAGFMGAGIAAVAAQHGTIVRLKDTEQARLGRGLSAARAVFSERLVRKQITRRELEDTMLMIAPTTGTSGFGRADVVIEAVFEDLDVKHQVLREIEPALRPEAVFASNTSTIPIGSIASAAAHPERVLGMHFFSPVHRMPLLEVIAAKATNAQSIVTAVAFGKRLGKTVIVVNDGPGFYTTRILSAYMNEAGKMLDEGASIESIDDALVAFGFPVGPITLLDEVGIDVGGKVGRVLSDAFGARMTASESLRKVVEAGRVGRKGKSGFYLYDEKGEKGKVDPSIYALLGRTERTPMESREVVQRCVLALVNEAAKCLDDGVLGSPRDGDIGAVFGLGFPPFRGGPFRFIDSVGADRILEQLEELNTRFAPRFQPAESIIEAARTRVPFHPGTRGLQS